MIITIVFFVLFVIGIVKINEQNKKYAGYKKRAGRVRSVTPIANPFESDAANPSIQYVVEIFTEKKNDMMLPYYPIYDRKYYPNNKWLNVWFREDENGVAEVHERKSYALLITPFAITVAFWILWSLFDGVKDFIPKLI